MKTKKKKTQRTTSRRNRIKMFGKMEMCSKERHYGFCRAMRAWAKVWMELMDYDKECAETGIDELIRILKSVEEKGYYDEIYYTNNDNRPVWAGFEDINIDWIFSESDTPFSISSFPKED
jgi:hypothetical protein